MSASHFNLFFVTILYIHTFLPYTQALGVNKTQHQQHTIVKTHNYPLYESYTAKKPLLSLAGSMEQQDEYIMSEEPDYNDVKSKYAGGSYDADENPPLYPNPETFITDDSRDEVQINMQRADIKPKEIELPDNSLADADLKDHNLIDSITYLYGYINSNTNKTDYHIVVYVIQAWSAITVAGLAVYIAWSQAAKSYRTHSKLFPVTLNLLCCLGVCNLIYMEAILGVTSVSRCEMIALLLHYSHLVCGAWISIHCWCLADYTVRAHVTGLRYLYLLAYGVTAVYVLFNYALSIEHYEVHHYCWMSIEKGMLIGLMLPGTVMIILTTVMSMISLNKLNKRHTNMITDKIHQLIDENIKESMKMPGGNEEVTSDDECPSNNCQTGTNRNDLTSSPDELEACDGATDQKCQNIDDDCLDYVNKELENKLKYESIKLDLMDLSIDNISFRSDSSFDEIVSLKRSLHMCLTLQPFHVVVWFLGVVALENSSYWLAPVLYMLVCIAMYVYLCYQLCTNLTMIQLPCEELVASSEQASINELENNTSGVKRSRTTDSIPLLDTVSKHQPTTITIPGDAISTISI